MIFSHPAYASRELRSLYEHSNNEARRELRRRKQLVTEWRLGASFVTFVKCVLWPLMPLSRVHVFFHPAIAPRKFRALYEPLPQLGISDGCVWEEFDRDPQVYFFRINST